MNIQVHIERVVLAGIELDAAAGLVLQAAIQEELGYLLAAQAPVGGLNRNSAAFVKVPGPIHLEANPNPAALGKQIALAVFAGLTA